MGVLKNSIFVVLALVMMANVSYGQETTGKFIQFKLYKSCSFDIGRTQGTTLVTLGDFSPAISWGKDQNFNEIEITSLNFFSRGRTSSYGGGAEYSYNFKVGGNDRKITAYFGGGVGGGFTTIFSSQTINNTTTFSTSGKTISAYLFAIPRVTYKIRSNILLDFSFSYSLIDFLNSRDKSANPNLPVNQQTTSTTDITPFPRTFKLKVGGIINF